MEVGQEAGKVTEDKEWQLAEPLLLCTETRTEGRESDRRRGAGRLS